MRQQAQEWMGRDRLSTLDELGEAIDLLVAKDQLPLSTLTCLESQGSQFESNSFELWAEADRDRLSEAAEIERLTNAVLGRSQKLN